VRGLVERLGSSVVVFGEELFQLSCSNHLLSGQI
jgi:hypothetical protein